MATIGAEGHEFVDWHDVYAGIDHEEAVVPGLILKGRWTAIVSAAKTGKSTFLLGLSVAAARAGRSIVYYDREMGLKDVHERIEEWMGLEPADLEHFHYCEVPSKFDTMQGAAKLGADVETHDPVVVIVDGLNGVVQGSENDDTTWRDLYEWAIAPCKARSIAFVSADNSGKDRTLGPRGSSVKLDKADAVLQMERTDHGVRLTATHRRTAAYPNEQHWAIVGANEDDPPLAVTLVETSHPEGTAGLVVRLDKLALPLDVSVRKAQAALRAADGEGANNAALSAALRARRAVDSNFWESPGNALVRGLGTSGNAEYPGNGDVTSKVLPAILGTAGQRHVTAEVSTLVAPLGGREQKNADGAAADDDVEWWKE